MTVSNGSLKVFTSACVWRHYSFKEDVSGNKRNQASYLSFVMSYTPLCVTICQMAESLHYIALRYYQLAPICQKLSLLEGWAHLHHYPSGRWHICRTPPGLGYLQWLFHSLSLTWDDDVLPISARSSKMAEEGATRKHLASRGWKLIRDADIDISSSIPIRSNAVE